MNRFALAASAALFTLPLLAGPAGAAPALVTTSLNMRAGPGTEYPVVAVLAPGTEVDVQGCLEGYGWCDVVIEQQRGWLSGAYLQAPAQAVPQGAIPQGAPAPQGGGLPLAGVAAAIGLPIIAFTLGNYWDSHYRDRPWYRDRDRWSRGWGGRPPAYSYAPPRFAPPPGHWRGPPPGHRPGPPPGHWRRPEPGRGGPPGHWRDGRGPDRPGPARHGWEGGRGGPPGHQGGPRRGPEREHGRGPGGGGRGGGPGRGGPDRGGPPGR
ncbi:SH3 domain-containing protein [Pseudoroseomonas cervicalis]|uniref:SH3 domain-containing protein n=1 Tax=Teichococcus cervicalis TaxID=204525 RepID=UPI0022F1D526|nr:SH3 domain-containing protein [Pseudoroseomonas cervicalis]WBV43852.1 SH3 domain-containing protein [Pseudoroseomonas cervicalis]